MYKKLLYSAPEAELLVVKFEENIMSDKGLRDIKGDNVLDDSDEWA